MDSASEFSSKSQINEFDQPLITDTTDDFQLTNDSNSGVPDLAVQAWMAQSDSSSNTALFKSNTGTGDLLEIQPLNWGSSAEGVFDNSMLLAQADGEPIKVQNKSDTDDGDDKKPTKESDKSEKPQEKDTKSENDKLRQSLRDAFLKGEDKPEVEKKEIEKVLEDFDPVRIENLAQEELEQLRKEVPEVDKYEEYDPSLIDKYKYPVLTALAAYAGYRIIKGAGKAVLQKVKGTESTETKAEGKSSEKGPGSEKESKGKEGETKTERTKATESESNGNRRTRRRRSLEVTEFKQNVEAESRGEGLYGKKVSKGSEAVLGFEKASKSLTKSEVELLKKEIARMKESGKPGEAQKGRNLERVVRTLENSSNPKIQEKAHEYIRNRVNEAKSRNLRGKVAKGVGIGMLVTAALAWYISEQENKPNSEEYERATVSGK